MTVNAFKPELQATADAKALSENKSGKGHARVLSEIQDHAAKGRHLWSKGRAGVLVVV